jgi:hypothetical protein
MPYAVRTTPRSVTSISQNDINNIDINNITNNNSIFQNINGYYWLYTQNDLSISSLNIGSNKVVIFTDGNVTINGNITLGGQGFFAIFARGNITISTSVGTQLGSRNPSLEGIFFAQGNINTGASTSPLIVRGSLVGLGRIDLNRNLDPQMQTGANNIQPAEYVEFAPDLILNFPPDLLRSGLMWEEVAP